MKAELINKKYRRYKDDIENILNELLPVVKDLDLQEIQSDIQKLYESLESPFMFVVIGEVKSGKSSFINSLTGENICAVDADICTDKVQQIVYSKEPFIDHKEKFFDIKGINAEILKDISIVDTPGTDSVISDHEKITRKFAPNSNLIFFVFPAINPHHSSSWEMLNIMKDLWSRNIVFIATQADRCTDKEIEVNCQKIRHYAAERGIPDPVIFTTSSKREIEGELENSGFQAVRDFITDTTSGGKHMIMKLNDRAKIASIIFEKLDSVLQKRNEILTIDKRLKEKITDKYTSGKENSIKEIEKILSRMTYVFERTSGDFLHKLKRALSTGNILKQALPIVRFKNSKSKIDRNFLESLIKDMNTSLEKDLSIEASDNAAYFIDGIKYRFSEIIREVDKARDHYTEKEGLQALDRFSSKREEILTELLNGLTEMSEDASLIPALEKHNPAIGDTVLKGGAIAAAGALLAIIAQGAVFDATGGILSALGILGAGGIILFKRNRLIKEFKKNIQVSNDKFHKELKTRFERRLGLIFGDIKRLFENLDNHISIESGKLEIAESTFIEQQKMLFKITEEIKKIH
ncbi:MAG: dynamin family protein [Spirochaetaceae bacterium]|nr:dynamin family protein [Spirochaetaceae bacterium]